MGPAKDMRFFRQVTARQRGYLAGVRCMSDAASETGRLRLEAAAGDPD
jgi:hypothetical protein